MTAPAPIRILIAEDHYIARVGTSTILRTQADFEVVGEARDGVEAVERYRALVPDVLITDLRMPGLDGVQVVATIAAEFPNARVLVLTHYDGDEDIFRALRAGARGYLTKNTGGDALIDAVRILMGGGRYFPPEIAARVVTRSVQSPLSAREQQVLDRIFAGMTNKEICGDLGIAERTVSLHVSNVLEKLGARSRTEAVTIALQRGLLQMPQRSS